MKKFKNSFKQKDEGLSIKSFAINIALSLLIFLGVFFVFSLLISLFLYNTPNPTALLDIATYSSLFVASFVACFFLSKKNGQKYLLGALIFGFLVVFVLFTVSIFTDTKLISIDSLLKLATLVFCIAGGLLGIKKEKRIRHKHR